MEIKSDANHFNISKVCRTCLIEKAAMRTLFVPDESIGQTVAARIMSFANVEIEDGDGLPSLICFNCIDQANLAFSFKQRCEQSDTNLRQYLKRAVVKDTIKQEEGVEATDYEVVGYLVNNFELDDSLHNSDKDKHDDFSKLRAPLGLSNTIKQEEKIEDLGDNFTMDNSPNSNDHDNEEDSMLMVPIRPVDTVKQEEESQLVGCPVDNFGLGNSSNKCDKEDEDDKKFRPVFISVGPDSVKQEEEVELTDHGVVGGFVDNSSNKCDEEDEGVEDFPMLTVPVDPAGEKVSILYGGEKLFVCKICNKGCSTEHNLSRHMKVHERKQVDQTQLKHICDYCTSVLPNAASLDIHIKQHTGKKPFLCNICRKSFKNRYSLDIHLRSHTGERPFSCEICQKKFQSKGNLNMHKRTHTKEKSFACEFCGKVLAHASSLKTHKQLHGTEKPFECKICRKKFLTVAKLKTHVMTHTNEKPFSLSCSSSLYKRMKVHTPSAKYDSKRQEDNTTRSKLKLKTVKVIFTTALNEKPKYCSKIL